MKLNPNFKLREIAGECIVVNQGSSEVSMTKIISLNASARVLFEALQGQTFEAEDVAKLLEDTYQIDQDRAEHDAAKWITSLKSCGVID